MNSPSKVSLLNKKAFTYTVSPQISTCYPSTTNSMNSRLCSFQSLNIVYTFGTRHPFPYTQKPHNMHFQKPFKDPLYVRISKVIAPNTLLNSIFHKPSCAYIHIKRILNLIKHLIAFYGKNSLGVAVEANYTMKV